MGSFAFSPVLLFWDVNALLFECKGEGAEMRKRDRNHNDQRNLSPIHTFNSILYILPSHICKKQQVNPPPPQKKETQTNKTLHYKYISKKKEQYFS